MGRRGNNRFGNRGIGFSSDVKSRVRNDRMFYVFYRHLWVLAMNRFDYENLPDYCERWMIEESMINNGSVLFFEAPAIGVTAFPYTQNGALNMFNVPTKRKVISITSYQPVRTQNNSVIVWNDDTRQPFISIIIYYADLLAQTERAKFINREQQKRTKGIVTTADNVETVRNMINQQKDGQPYIIQKPEFVDSSRTEAIDLTTPIILKELDDEKNAIYSEYLTILGYNNVSIDKKAQLTSGEAFSNIEHTMGMRNNALTCRQEGIEKVNKKFGTDIQVRFSLDGNGGWDVGTIHNDITGPDISLQSDGNTD